MTQGQSRKRTTKVRKRKSGFKVNWVKFPARWANRLCAAGVPGTTWRLAIAILFEGYKFDQMAIREIVLSKEVTGLARRDRNRAINDLVRLRMIRVKRRAGTLTRVTGVFD
jgi:hypothetical protein